MLTLKKGVLVKIIVIMFFSFLVLYSKEDNQLEVFGPPIKKEYYNNSYDKNDSLKILGKSYTQLKENEKKKKQIEESENLNKKFLEK